MKKSIALTLCFAVLVGSVTACTPSPESPSPEMPNPDLPGPSPEPLNPEVQEAIQNLRSEDEDMREAAIEVLVGIGLEAVPALTQTLEGEDETVRASGAEALAAITGQDFGQNAAAWQQ